MAYNFQIYGWEDQDGNRHFTRHGPVKRAPLSRTYGTYVKVTNQDDPADVAWWWAFVYTPFESWDEWYVYIAALAAQHGYDLA